MKRSFQLETLDETIEASLQGEMSLSCHFMGVGTVNR